MTIAGAPRGPWGRAERRRVLVCDDERHIVRLIQVILERQGHTVVCAFGDKEAIELMESADQLYQPGFDMAVIDAQMPGLDGYEVLKWIRTQDRTFTATVIMMLPNGEQPEIWEQRSFRADKYLVKPFNPMELFG